jgi:serine/threonine protein kinase
MLRVTGNSGRPVSKFARIFQKIITYNHSTNKHTFKFLETKAECYQIGRHIDSGGSSNVYECFTVEDFDEEFRVRVTDRNFVPAKEKQHKVLAVKVLDGDLDRANLEQEVKNIQRLNHMHVIRARAIGSFEGNVGIVLEPRAYGDGGNNNLREYLTTHLRTDPQDAGGILSKNRSQIIRHLIGWMRCLLGTICYLHSEGIRHRDIKPENILIHDTRIILTDFGISFPTGTTKHSNKWNTTQPGTTTNVGTMKYLPPDAIIDSNKAGDQSGIINRVGKGGDIFSLGCVFWEMLELLWKPSRVVFSQPKSSKSYADFWQTMRLGGGGKTGIYEKIGKMVDQLDDFLDKESKKGENAKDIEALRTVMVETLFLIPNMVMVRFNRQLDALRLRSRLETAIRDSWSVIRAHESVRGEREFCPCTVE